MDEFENVFSLPLVYVIILFASPEMTTSLHPVTFHLLILTFNAQNAIALSKRVVVRCGIKEILCE
jgi:hypothetical protein